MRSSGDCSRRPRWLVRPSSAAALESISRGGRPDGHRWAARRVPRLTSCRPPWRTGLARTVPAVSLERDSRDVLQPRPV